MLALESGKSIRWVADQLGHSDPALTLRVYAHVLPEEELDLSFAYFGGSERLYPAPGLGDDDSESRSVPKVGRPKTPAISEHWRGARSSLSARGAGGNPCSLAEVSLFPNARNTPARTPRTGRIGDAGLAESRDLDNFPVFSLRIRDSGSETSSR